MSANQREGENDVKIETKQGADVSNKWSRLLAENAHKNEVANQLKQSLKLVQPRPESAQKVRTFEPQSSDRDQSTQMTKSKLKMQELKKKIE